MRLVMGVVAITMGCGSILTQSVPLGLLAIVFAILAQETTVNVYSVED